MLHNFMFYVLLTVHGFHYMEATKWTG